MNYTGRYAIAAVSLSGAGENRPIFANMFVNPLSRTGLKRGSQFWANAAAISSQSSAVRYLHAEVFLQPHMLPLGLAESIECGIEYAEGIRRVAFEAVQRNFELVQPSVARGMMLAEFRNDIVELLRAPSKLCKKIVAVLRMM